VNFASRMLKSYFNFAYNPTYDLTVAKLNHYQKLQGRCIDKLDLKDNDYILCAGIGTGNEIIHILQRNSNVNIVGIDFSMIALKKACKKALAYGKEIELLHMDLTHLEFATSSFDKLLCIHVMDFVNDCTKVTNEIIRVLKDGGEFVITYPSGKENVNLGLNLLKDNFRYHTDSGKNYLRIFLDLIVQISAGIVCLPMIFRPKKRFYSKRELENIFIAYKVGDFSIEEDRLYNDFIIYGRK
jgi:ubiquinone/menaquinone biosynthesis C-methylase UbiE